MNYLLEIKAFYDRLEVKPLSTSAIALWHALMHTCNKTGWVEEFSVAVTVLSLKTGLSERSVTNARNELKTKGYIEFKSRSGNRSAVYKLVPLSANVAYKLSDSVSDSTSDSVSDNPSALFKQNETKRNKKKKGESSSVLANQVKEIWEHYKFESADLFPRGQTLTAKRRKKIEDRLKDKDPDTKEIMFTVEDIKSAISNLKKSPWHCGENPSGKVYFDIELICRSPEKIEEWMNYIPSKKPISSNSNVVPLRPEENRFNQPSNDDLLRQQQIEQEMIELMKQRQGRGASNGV